MRKIAILGAGESGYGSAVLAKQKGYDVFVSDSGKIAEKYRTKLVADGFDFEEGGHTVSMILDADEIVKSPGIPDDAGVVQAARSHGIPVISEIEFAGRYLAGARTICVTGSNGKTTTTMLAYRLLKEAGFNVALGGNVGDSFALKVAEREHDWYVLEISSFQLDGMREFRADIAVLMNITPDHLDRYGYRMQSYIDSKMRIVQNQTYNDFFIYGDDDLNIRAEMARRELPMRLLPFTAGSDEGITPVAGHRHGPLQGAFASGDDFIAVVGERRFAMPVGDLRIKGLHNVYDAMAATMAAMAAGVPDDSLRSTLENFDGVEHRMEPAGQLAGVEYINDSKATNVDSTWYALQAMTKPVVWIAGGTDKGNDYTPLKEFAATKVKALICMGVDNTKLTEAFGGVVPVIYDTHSLEEAMTKAWEAAEPGDVVLLSPACASFDLFKNYEERGERFKQWIEMRKNREGRGVNTDEQ